MDNSSKLGSNFHISSLFMPFLVIFLLTFPLLGGFVQPKLMQKSDYLITFYPSGRAVSDHRMAELYPSGPGTSFKDSALDHLSHQMLPEMPKDCIGTFMYSPVTAIPFAPYSMMSPQSSLFCWQITSILTLLLSVFLISKAIKYSFMRLLCYAVLNAAIFYTIFVGQVGIVFGLLPLSWGYLLIVRKRYYLAGLSWSFLLLKPQFLPVALLIVGALLLKKKYKCALGFFAGIFLLIAFTSLYSSPLLFIEWIKSFKVSESSFLSPEYTYCTYLMISLPAVVLQLFPVALREAVKIPVYLFVLGLSLHALWISWQILDKNEEEFAIPAVMTIGIAILPLVIPHFFFYEFSIFTLLLIMCSKIKWPPLQNGRLMVLSWLYLISFDLYYVLFNTPARQLAQPAILVAIMALFYYRLLSIINIRQVNT